MSLYPELNTHEAWPRESGIAEIRFEISRWYPVDLVYVAPGEKVSKAICEAGKQFRAAFGKEAEVAFIRTIPQGAEEFIEIQGMTLVQADWVQERFVAICRRGCQVIEEGFQNWKKLKEVEHV